MANVGSTIAETLSPPAHLILRRSPSLLAQRNSPGCLTIDCLAAASPTVSPQSSRRLVPVMIIAGERISRWGCTFGGGPVKSIGRQSGRPPREVLGCRSRQARRS